MPIKNIPMPRPAAPAAASAEEGRPVTVTLQPAAIALTGREGQTILEICEEHDIPLEHSCGGNCACSTCHVIIRQGMEHVSEAEEDELDQLDEAEGLTLRSRLGCQTKVYGDVTVEIPKLPRAPDGNP
jgi:2Fe-2S ferredoxin